MAANGNRRASTNLVVKVLLAGLYSIAFWVTLFLPSFVSVSVSVSVQAFVPPVTTKKSTRIIFSSSSLQLQPHPHPTSPSHRFPRNTAIYANKNSTTTQPQATTQHEQQQQQQQQQQYKSDKEEEKEWLVDRVRSVNYFISRKCNYACKFCFHTQKVSSKNECKCGCECQYNAMQYSTTKTQEAWCGSRSNN